ncbi:MAG: septum formation initiator family protein, partial [Verrucomicrobiota bacterium]|nr:septum formation initiator family protein [Verrucomicrobiota bacterium]
MNQPAFADFQARRDATVWHRLNRIVLVLLFLALWFGIITLFVPPYKRMMAARAEIDGLQTQVNEQKSIVARATREVSLLKSDPTYLE